MVKDWKDNKKKGISSSQLKLFGFIVPLIIILYILLLTILYAVNSGELILVLGFLSALIFALVMIFSFGMFAKKASFDIISLSGLYLGFGAILFLLGKLLPNVNGLFKASNPVNIVSWVSLAVMGILGMILLVLGFFLS